MAEIKLMKYLEKKEELLELFNISFGHDMSPELWDWKYIQNPFAPNSPEIVVAIDKNKLVGARPLLLSEMWIGDIKIKAAQPCDTMVHPQYRREQLFTRMNQLTFEFLKQRGFAFFYNFPNELACPGYLKQGWMMVSSTEHLFEMISPKKVLSYKLRNRFIGTVAGCFYNCFLKSKMTASPSPTPFQIKVFDQITDEFMEVDSLRDKSALDLVRSENYLRWRFDHHPENKYRYIIVKNLEHVCGYAVIYIQKTLKGSDDLNLGIIVDYVVKDNDLDCVKVLLDKCLRELSLEADFISIWAFSQPELKKELTKILGFRSSASFPYNRLMGKGNFIVRKISDKLPGNIDIYDICNWRVTDAYKDVL